MGVQAIYSIQTDNWYNQEEAQEVLDNAVADLQEYKKEQDKPVEWIVVGFPYGIGSHYLMTVFCGGQEKDEWPQTYRRLPENPTVHVFDGSKEHALKAMKANGSKFMPKVF